MPRFGAHSQAVLATCHPALVRLADEVVKHYNFKALRGVRSLPEQSDYVSQGWSQTHNSRHLPGGGLRRISDGAEALTTKAWAAAVAEGNVEPIDPDGFSFALDAAPWRPGIGVVYDPHELIQFGGILIATGWSLGIEIRWGGDWDGDHNLHDQNFFDRVHSELLRT